MSWRDMNDLFRGDLGPISSSDLLVLLLLRVRAGDKDVCFPSQPSIAKDTRLSVRKVRECIGKLSRLGLIEVRERQHNRRSNEYLIAPLGRRLSARAAVSTPLKTTNSGRFRQNTGTPVRQTPASPAPRKNKGKEKERERFSACLAVVADDEVPTEERTCKPSQLTDLIRSLGRGCA